MIRQIEMNTFEKIQDDTFLMVTAFIEQCCMLDKVFGSGVDGVAFCIVSALYWLS